MLNQQHGYSARRFTVTAGKDGLLQEGVGSISGAQNV
jgi:hypothetical protein